jgi:hypothetical protein
MIIIPEEVLNDREIWFGRGLKRNKELLKVFKDGIRQTKEN